MAFPVHNEWRRQGCIALAGLVVLIPLQLGLLWWQGALTGNYITVNGIIWPALFIFSGLAAVALGIVAGRAGADRMEIKNKRQAAAAFRAVFLPGLISALLLAALALTTLTWPQSGIPLYDRVILSDWLKIVFYVMLPILLYSGAFFNTLAVNARPIIYVIVLPAILLEAFVITAFPVIYFLAVSPAFLLTVSWLIWAGIAAERHGLHIDVESLLWTSWPVLIAVCLTIFSYGSFMKMCWKAALCGCDWLELSDHRSSGVVFSIWPCLSRF